MRKLLAVIFTVGVFFTPAVNIAQAQAGEKTCVVVVDEKAYDETVIDSEGAPAQHYSYVGGPIEGQPATTPPGDDWQANTQQEPHLNNPNVTWVDGYGVGLHYTSNGSSGLADWFYFQPAVDEVSHIVHHDAVTHKECTKTPPPPHNPKPPTPGNHSKDLAFTGLTSGERVLAGAGLALALTGGGLLWLSRRRRFA